MARRKVSIMADYGSAWAWINDEGTDRLGSNCNPLEDITDLLNANLDDWQAEFERAPSDAGRLPAWAEQEDAMRAERLFAPAAPESALEAAERLFADSEYNKRLHADPDYVEPGLIIDWDAFHRRGIELTKRLKAQLGPDVVVHYHVPCEDTRSSWAGQVFEIMDDGSAVPIAEDRLRRA